MIYMVCMGLLEFFSFSFFYNEIADDILLILVSAALLK